MKTFQLLIFGIVVDEKSSYTNRIENF